MLQHILKGLNNPPPPSPAIKSKETTDNNVVYCLCVFISAFFSTYEGSSHQVSVDEINIELEQE